MGGRWRCQGPFPELLLTTNRINGRYKFAKDVGLPLSISHTENREGKFLSLLRPSHYGWIFFRRTAREYRCRATPKTEQPIAPFTLFQ
jgi:hypothetical protein